MVITASTNSLLAILMLLLHCQTINAFSPIISHNQPLTSIQYINQPLSLFPTLNRPSNPIRQVNQKQVTLSSSTTTTCIYGITSSDDNMVDPTIESTWKEISKSVFESDTRPVILFDGVCNLCNGGVNYALDNDSVGKFRFASLQSKIGQSLLLRSGKKPNDISSIVLVTEDKSYFKSDAVLRIARKLDGNALLPLMGFFGFLAPGFARNVVYDVVADNRYRFGQSDSCRIDDGEFFDRFISDPQ